ncbi:hypothetical protein BKA93DRAFT_144117 [Sparassis latifolia]
MRFLPSYHLHADVLSISVLVVLTMQTFGNTSNLQFMLPHAVEHKHSAACLFSEVEGHPQPPRRCSLLVVAPATAVR